MRFLKQITYIFYCTLVRSKLNIYEVLYSYFEARFPIQNNNPARTTFFTIYNIQVISNCYLLTQ